MIFIILLACLIVILQFYRRKYLEGMLNLCFYGSIYLIFLGINTEKNMITNMGFFILLLSTMGLAIYAFLNLRKRLKRQPQ
ncbi:hypothetical protein AWU65_03225 [Paenibacillus glucanolyticus]|uniref:Uncharacterized protein n=1 Tax=Paenibacillus glucanolyticus TaxID=59843 RepID=A0A163GJM1_9BACL|nr:hypothetical protein AWU65_03225 [Paenibacillus glucanolyticus]OMF64138.1 hypothetical protein BK142_32110 [Paenibacillus glucanolyticus]